MDYQKVIEQARTCIGPYCKACAVCNGRACKNTMPGPVSYTHLTLPTTPYV